MDVKQDPSYRTSEKDEIHFTTQLEIVLATTQDANMTDATHAAWRQNSLPANMDGWGHTRIRPRYLSSEGYQDTGQFPNCSSASKSLFASPGQALPLC
jgi:hypothetical protein